MGTGPIKSPVPNLISRYNIKCSVAVGIAVGLLLGICNPQRKSIGIYNPKFNLPLSPHRTEEEDPSMYPPHRACGEILLYVPLPAPAERFSFVFPSLRLRGGVRGGVC